MPFLDYNISNSIVAGTSFGNEYIVFEDDISLIDLNEKYHYFRNSYYLIFDYLDSDVYPRKGFKIRLMADREFPVSYISDFSTDTEKGTDFIIFTSEADFMIPLQVF